MRRRSSRPGARWGPALAAEGLGDGLRFLLGAAEQVFAVPAAFGVLSRASKQTDRGEQGAGAGVRRGTGRRRSRPGRSSRRGWGPPGPFSTGTRRAEERRAGPRRRPSSGRRSSGRRSSRSRSEVSIPRSPTHDDLAEAEAVPQFLDRGGDRLGVGGVPGEGLDGGRAAFPGAGPPEGDPEGAAFPWTREGAAPRRRRLSSGTVRSAAGLEDEAGERHEPARSTRLEGMNSSPGSSSRRFVRERLAWVSSRSQKQASSLDEKSPNWTPRPQRGYP